RLRSEGTARDDGRDRLPSGGHMERRDPDRLAGDGAIDDGLAARTEPCGELRELPDGCAVGEEHAQLCRGLRRGVGVGAACRVAELLDAMDLTARGRQSIARGRVIQAPGEQERTTAAEEE